jgi:hypothetical protein
LRALVARLLPALASKAPRASLHVLEQVFLRGIPEGQHLVGTLLPVLPQEVFALIGARGLPYHAYSFGPVATRLTTAQLCFLLREHPTALQDPKHWFDRELREESVQAKREAFIKKWFAQRPEVIDAWLYGQHRFPTWGLWLLPFLRPEQQGERTKVYERWSVATRNAESLISAGHLHILPWDLREREARRHLTEVKKLSTQPLLRLQYYPFLPWIEAKEHFTPWLSHPEPEVRIEALQSFLGTFGARLKALGDDPEGVQEALELIRARRYEQDPVRQVMLQALAEWPAKVFRKEHLPVIEEICRAALDAADLSHTTAAHLARWISALLPLAPGFAADRLLEVLHTRGALDSNLGANRSPKEVVTIGTALLRIADRFVARGMHGNMVALAQSLKEHLPLVLGFAERLKAEVERVVNTSALSLLLRYFRPQFDELIAAAYQRQNNEGKANFLLALLAQFRPDEALGVFFEICLKELQTKRKKNAAALMIALFRKSPEPFLAKLHTIEAAHKANDWEDLFCDFVEGCPASLHRPEILARVEARLHQVPPYVHALPLLNALKSERKSIFAEWVPALLRRDPSFVAAPPIYQFLDWERQDLLDTVLDGVLPRGNYFGANDKHGWLLPSSKGAYRWTPAQQERFARALDKRIGDPDQSIPAARALLVRRVALPHATADGLAAFARDTRAAVKETTIRALARLDAGQGVPTLLECLGDDRARFAIYGFRKALLELPPAPAVDLLRKTPLQKVTVAKELMRILGELRTEEAYQFLLSLDSPTLHRDVRVAQLRALWEHLERPASWEALHRAARASDWILAAKIAELPTERLSEESERKMSALMAVLLERPEPEARVALLGKVSTIPLVDGERHIFARCLALFASEYPDEFQAAGRAVLYRARQRDIAAVVARYTEILPLRRQWWSAFQLLLAAHPNPVTQEIQRGVLADLAKDPLLAPQALLLAAMVLSWTELLDLLRRFSQQGVLHVDAMVQAYSALQRIPRGDINKAESTLATESAPELRRLGLFLLERGAREMGRGWGKQRRERLDAYRNDPSPLVAGAASLVMTPD